MDSTIRLIQNGRQCVSGVQDQAAFSLAVSEAAHPPFVLPLNWNFRPMVHSSWYGPIKIWHGYEEVPAAVARFCARQSHPQAIVEFARIEGGRFWTDGDGMRQGAPGVPAV